jgi:hypothetical protein
MPLGLEEVVPTFECAMPGGHGEWQPLRRTVHDDEGTHEVFSCYEDGARVTSHPVTVPVAYVEYGWLESTPARTPAPCDHLPVGLYEYDVIENTCTWMMSLAELTDLFRAALVAPGAGESASHRATRDALLRLTGSGCHDCPPETPDGDEDADDGVDAGPALADGGVAPAADHDTTPAATVRPSRARRRSATSPGGCPSPQDPPFAFYAPEGCHGDWSGLVLELVARQVSLSVGVSYRGGNERRCVPSEYRRDGYVHLLLPDGELVFAVTRDAPREVVLVEDVRSTTPPPALGTTCTE